MQALSYYLKNPRKLGVALIHRMEWLPDKLYLQLLYFFEMGKPLNLKSPHTFQEKIQWLKLYNRRPEYTTMVDKFAVKDYVSKIIGAEYIIPTIGIWDKFSDIDFNILPKKFVLKTTHGGGGCGVVLCHDKSKFDKERARKILEASLKSDIYRSLREWPYKNVPRRIIAEELLEIPESDDLSDYKIFCFNGKPRFLKVDFGRFVEHHANYYDLDWKLLPFGEEGLMPVATHNIPKPSNLDRMLDLAVKLSLGHPFVRVDFYNIAGRIFFGELTFYPGSGTIHFGPREWDIKVGKMLDLDLS